VGGADRGEDQRDFIVFHQPPGLLHGFRRRVAVVKRDQVDLAAVDAAALIEHLEIADLTLAERAERRDRPAVRHGLADLDFGCGDAAHFGCDRGGRPYQHGKRARYKSPDKTHRHPLPFYFGHASDCRPWQARFSPRARRKHAMAPGWMPIIVIME
jgi:hypothetical protein